MMAGLFSKKNRMIFGGILAFMGSSIFPMQRARTFLNHIFGLQPVQRMTQTEAALYSIPAEIAEQELRHEKFNPDLNIAQYLPFLEKKIVATEKAYPHHYSFVHAHSKVLRILFDVYACLNRSGIRKYPLRLSSDLSTLYVPEYLKKYDMKKESNYDDDHQKYLLSVNLSGLGSLYRPESSMRYFIEDHSASTPDELASTYLSECITGYDKLDGIVKLHFEHIIEQLSGLLESKEGCMVQILIPEPDVDKYVYLARAAGHVCTEKLYLNDGRVLPGYNKEMGYYTHISPLLNLYKEKPALVKDIISKAQARIIMHKDLFERDDVKIVCHMMDDVESNREYKQAIEFFATVLAAGNYDVEGIIQRYITTFSMQLDHVDSSIRRSALVEVLNIVMRKTSKTQEIIKLINAHPMPDWSAIESDILFAFGEVCNKGIDIQKAGTMFFEMSKLENGRVRGAILSNLSHFIKHATELKELLRLIIFYTKDSNKYSRYCAFFMLGELIEKDFDMQEALKLIVEGCKDSDGRVRMISFDGLKKIVEKGHGAKEALELMPLACLDSFDMAQWRAFDVLETLIINPLTNKQALELLVQCCNRGDRSVRIRVFYSLERLVQKGYGIKEASELVVLGLKDSYPPVQQQAWAVQKKLPQARL